MALEARQYTGNNSVCYNRYGRAYRCNTAWNSWGRWVALGVILVGAFFLFFICSCVSARRRRKRGNTPFYGTGWAGRVPVGSNQAQYNPNYNQTQQPQYNQTAPPNYDQSAGTGGYYGANQSYFGGQRDVEMQPPQNTHSAGGENVYQAPAGPPPGKHA